MKKSIILLLLLPWGLANAISLSEAYRDKDLEIRIHGADDELFAGKGVQIDVVSHKPTAIKITEDPGYIFISDEEDVQDMILTEPLMLVLNPNSTSSVGVYAMCIQASNGSPFLDTNFGSGKRAEGNLLKTSKYISEFNYNNSMGQDAIWAISDEHSVYDISGPPETANPLRAFMAELTNIPFDTTQINKNENYVSRSVKDFALYLTFFLLNSDDIKLQLFDQRGDHVRDLINKEHQMKGKYNMEYKVSLIGLVGQKYFVRLYVGDEMRKEFTLVISES